MNSGSRGIRGHGGIGITEVPIDLASTLDRFTQPDMWWGVAVGILFIAAAVWIRRYRDEV